MSKSLDESKNIINYLKYQRVPFNRELPKVLENYSFNTTAYRNSKSREKNMITQDIKKSINIFKDVCTNYNINYLNYVLILESLPNDKIKNLYRFFSFKWNYLLNKEEQILGPEKEKYKFKHSYSEVYHSSKPKILLLETLEKLKKVREMSIIYFIGCMNQFTT